MQRCLTDIRICGNVLNMQKSDAHLAAFAKRLRVLRAEHEVTVEEIAENTAVTKSTIYRYLRGEQWPDLETAGGIARTFGLTIDELYDREVAA